MRGLARRIGQRHGHCTFDRRLIQRRDARPARLADQQFSVPASMKRCCQRQTQVLDVPVMRMISLVPTPSAKSSTICTR